MTNSRTEFPLNREFQTIAVQLLDQCFITEETTSSQLLTYELKNWGKTTNLSLAVSSGHTLFVAHSCSQELLTDIWGGVMTFRTQKSLKVDLELLSLSRKNYFAGFLLDLIHKSSLSMLIELLDATIHFVTTNIETDSQDLRTL